MNQISTYGYRQEHTAMVLSYCKSLLDAVMNMELTDNNSIQQIQKMLEQSAIFLLKIQDLVTSQVYFIGVH